MPPESQSATEPRDTRTSPPTDHHRLRPSKYTPTLFVLAVVCCIALGLFIRFENLAYRPQKPDDHAVTSPEKPPVVFSADGYYYLKTARELLEGTYTDVDHDRYVPQGDQRPNTPPLLSVLTAVVTFVTGLSLEKTALLLSPLLGVLLFVPVFLLGRYFAGSVTGMLAGFFALIHPVYAFRSSAGWFDTDILNVTLATAALYCFLRFGTAQNLRQRAQYLTSGFVVFGMFLWLWESDVVAGLCLFPLFVALILYYRPAPKEACIVYPGIAVVLIVFTVWFPDLLDVEKLYQKATYILSDSGTAQGSKFPVTAAFVGEQQTSWQDLSPTKTAPGLAFLLGGLAGFAWLAGRFKTKALFFGPIVAVAALSVTAVRFQIFFAPTLALGLGFLIRELWTYRHKSWLFGVAGCLFGVAPAVTAFSAINQQNKQRSPRPPYYVKALREIKRITPDNAVIWTKWGYGYATQFYSRRGTIADGAHHGGRLMLVSSVPLATYDDKLAANWIQFYTAHGMQGLQRVKETFGDNWASGIKTLKSFLQAGPEGTRNMLQSREEIKQEDVQRWLTFLFPRSPRPAYLFLDRRRISQPQWFAFGHWDLKAGEGTLEPYVFFPGVQTKPNDIVIGRRSADSAIIINKSTGKYKVNNDPAQGGQLSAIRFYDTSGKILKQKTYGKDEGACFEVLVTKQKTNGNDFIEGRGIFAGKNIVTSTFHRLFIRHDYNDPYLEPIQDKAPAYQLWKVNGDSVDSQGENNAKQTR